MSLCTEGIREAENTLRHLAFPQFSSPRRNVKGSFDFPCPCPLPALDRLVSLLWGGKYGLGGGAASTPWPAHGPAPHSTLCLGLLTKTASLPYVAQRSPTCSHVPSAPLGRGLAHKVLLNSHTSVDIRRCFYARTAAQGLSPWDQEHLQGHQISKQAAKTHSGKNCLLKRRFLTLLSHEAQIHILINRQLLNKNPRKCIIFSVIPVKKYQTSFSNKVL